MRRAAALLLALFIAACGGVLHRAPQAPPQQQQPDEPLPVKKVQEEIVVAAWAEPPHLPRGGGAAQVLVRVQKRGGAPFPGVEVRLAASTGTLYSQGQILFTDNRGMTRDRLTTRQTASVTLNAGGTRYSFKVPVGDATPDK